MRVFRIIAVGLACVACRCASALEFSTNEPSCGGIDVTITRHAGDVIMTEEIEMSMSVIRNTYTLRHGLVVRLVSESGLKYDHLANPVTPVLRVERSLIRKHGSDPRFDAVQARANDLWERSQRNPPG